MQAFLFGRACPKIIPAANLNQKITNGLQGFGIQV
jgi:hypothetical protein